MSTNFYVKTAEGDIIHVGKRSGAGLYCHKCGVTTCEGGESAIHYGRNAFSQVCPECGIAAHVSSTCSFTWAMAPHKLESILYFDGKGCVSDEYGELFSLLRFYDILRNDCRIQFYDSIGTEFS